MQKILMMIVCLLVAAFLTSCNGREDRLEYQLEQSKVETAKLQKSFDELVAAVKSDQVRREANERAAGIAAGCDWMIPLCPITLVETGREAIQNGYTPNLFYFWINALIKVTLVGVLIAALVSLSTLLYVKFMAQKQVAQEQTTFSFLSPDEALLLNSHCLKGEIMEYENELDNSMQVVKQKNDLILKLSGMEEQLIKSLESLNERHGFLKAEVTRLESLHVVLKVLD